MSPQKETISKGNFIFQPLIFMGYVALPETNMSPLKIGHPKRILVFQPSIFRGELLVSERVVFGSGIQVHPFFH